jgi:hypothetical protein
MRGEGGVMQVERMGGVERTPVAEGGSAMRYQLTASKTPAAQQRGARGQHGRSGIRNDGSLPHRAGAGADAL